MSDAELEVSQPAEPKRRPGRPPGRGRGNYRSAPAPLPREATVEMRERGPTVEDLEREIRALGQGEGLTRQRRGLYDQTFDIPEQGKLPGWDYEWKTVTVNNQPIDASEATNYHRNGWRLVPASHFPSLTAPGWPHPYIENWGQRLMMRPMRLTEEARKESQEMAFAQKQARLEQQFAGEGGRDQAPRLRPEFRETREQLL